MIMKLNYLTTQYAILNTQKVVISYRLSEKGSKSQMSSMQSLLFDPLSWFRFQLSVICCQLSEKSRKSQISTELSFVFDPLS